jgi:thiol:disulfide interchange protein DsbA
MFKISLKRVFTSLLTATLLSGAAISASAQSNGGVTPLDPPQPTANDGTVEVLEFFAYGCIHCASLEPSLEEWAKRQPADVKLVRVPAAFAIRGVDSVPLFYTLQAMGQIERLHNKILIAINNDNVNLAVPALLNKWLAANGVNPAKYEEVQKSFSVQTNITRGRKMTTDYKVDSTPMIVVNGRASVSANGGPQRMFAMVDQLVNEARAGMAKAASSAKPAKPAAKKPAAKAPAAPASN